MGWQPNQCLRQIDLVNMQSKGRKDQRGIVVSTSAPLVRRLSFYYQTIQHCSCSLRWEYKSSEWVDIESLGRRYLINSAEPSWTLEFDTGSRYLIDP